MGENCVFVNATASAAWPELGNYCRAVPNAIPLTVDDWFLLQNLSMSLPHPLDVWTGLQLTTATAEFVPNASHWQLHTYANGPKQKLTNMWAEAQPNLTVGYGATRLCVAWNANFGWSSVGR